MDSSNIVDGVGLVGALVRPVALDSGESQRDASRIARARLHAIEGDLDDDLGAHVHSVKAAQFTGLEPRKASNSPLRRQPARGAFAPGPRQAYCYKVSLSIASSVVYNCDTTVDRTPSVGPLVMRVGLSQLLQPAA